MTHRDQGVVMTHQNQGGMMTHQDQEKGESIISNRLTCLNNEVILDWLNLSPRAGADIRDRK